MFGFVGGGARVMLGQKIFRHKTLKQSFKTRFITSVIMTIAVLVVMYQCYPW
ncbi:DUF1294 domain-containing protein [Yersinia pseudotuberculosis]|uniref:DUF1294 domain-containing protein n=1 Tax=Yersinia pseudotuberculosis TaxID=633 RepID=UPI0036F1C06D